MRDAFLYVMSDRTDINNLPGLLRTRYGSIHHAFRKGFPDPQKGNKMVDFSKKRKKSTRIIAVVIAGLLVLGMVIGLLVSI